MDEFMSDKFGAVYILVPWEKCRMKINYLIGISFLSPLAILETHNNECIE